MRISSEDKVKFDQYVFPVLHGLDIDASVPGIVEKITSQYTKEGYIRSYLITGSVTENIEYVYKRQDDEKTTPYIEFQQRGYAWWMWFKTVPRWSRFLTKPLNELTSSQEIKSFKERIKKNKNIKPIRIKGESVSKKNDRIAKELSKLTGIDLSNIKEVLTSRGEFIPQTLDEIASDIRDLVAEETNKDMVFEQVFDYGDKEFATEIETSLVLMLKKEVEKDVVANLVDTLKGKEPSMKESAAITMIARNTENQMESFYRLVVNPSISHAFVKNPFRNRVISMNPENSYYTAIFDLFKNEADKIINNSSEDEQVEWREFIKLIELSFMFSLHHMISTFVNAT